METNLKRFNERRRLAIVVDDEYVNRMMLGNILELGGYDVLYAENGEEALALIRENQEKLFKASCYGFTGFKAFRYIRLPAALPSLMAGAESVFGLCWKVVAAGEVLSIPRYGAGSLMQYSQLHLETADTLAYTLAIIIFSYIGGKVIHKIIHFEP